MDEQGEPVWRFLVAVAGPQDADDCFQETFLAALRAYPRLKPGANLRAWVFTIAHRKAIDAHRARRRHPEPVEDLGDHATTEQSPQPRDDGLWELVGSLPPKQRAAVVLRYVADLRHAEAAEVLGSSEEAMRRNLHEALTKLRKEWTP